MQVAIFYKHNMINKLKQYTKDKMMKSQGLLGEMIL